MTNQLDAIIFDNDGVLSSTAKRQEEWLRHWTEKHNQDWPFQSFEEFLTFYNDTLHSAVDVPTGVQNIYDFLRAPCDMKDKEHPVWIAYNIFKEDHPTGLFPGVKDMLDEVYQLGSLTKDPTQARRMRMAINTTNSWKSIASELKKADVLHYFDTQTAMEMLDEYHGAQNGNAIKKPSKLSVALTLQNLGTEGARTMHLGDTRTDLMASKQVIRPGYGPSNAEDLIMVGAAWGYEGRETLERGAKLPNGTQVQFDHIIDNPGELVQLVKIYRGLE